MPILRNVLLLVTLASPLAAQSPLAGLHDVRMAVSVDARNGESPPISVPSIERAIRSTLKRGGLHIVETEDAPLIFFGVLISVVHASPSTLYVVRYEYTLTENVRTARMPTVTIPASTWSAGGAVDAVFDPAGVSGAIERMAAQLSEKLNRARGAVSQR